jgi:3'(2'), 5'-bisphosphate nucleotidase
MPNKTADNPHDKERFLTTALLAALEAGEAIQEIYHTGFEVEYKKDHSPLTQADKNAHDIIVRHLSTFGIPILSEEGKTLSYQERKTWDTLWIVDPLDGTKEFVKRNGEFTVNIALVKKGIPVMGVVYAPDRDLLYLAMTNLGTYKISDTGIICSHKDGLKSNRITLADILKTGQQLPLADQKQKPYTIVGSRSHATPDLERFVAKKRAAFGEVDFIPAGSSLKICLVAEGVADIYPRLAPTMEWDTAAGHAVAANAGARIYEYESGNTLSYNKENLLNPWFIIEGSKDSRIQGSEGKNS